MIVIEKVITASTNDDARALVSEGVVDNTVIVAEEQTKGRGRQGREWVSQKGNLFCSFVVRPVRPVREFPLYSFVMACAVRDAVQAFLSDATVQVKWPNDVLVEGKKIAGLLLEVEGSALIVGVGVNCAHFPIVARSPFSLEGEGARRADEGALGRAKSVRKKRLFVASNNQYTNKTFLSWINLALRRAPSSAPSGHLLLQGRREPAQCLEERVTFPATSLASEGAVVSAKDFLSVLCDKFTHWRTVFDEKGFAAIRQEWIHHAWRWQQEIDVKKENALLRGKLIDLAGDGALILCVAGEEQRITSGDVWA